MFVVPQCGGGAKQKAFGLRRMERLSEPTRIQIWAHRHAQELGQRPGDVARATPHPRISGIAPGDRLETLRLAAGDIQHMARPAKMGTMPTL